LARASSRWRRTANGAEAVKRALDLNFATLRTLVGAADGVIVGVV
jgi:hypothetical protein